MSSVPYKLPYACWPFCYLLVFCFLRPVLCSGREEEEREHLPPGLWKPLEGRLFQDPHALSAARLVHPVTPHPATGPSWWPPASGPPARDSSLRWSSVLLSPLPGAPFPPHLTTPAEAPLECDLCRQGATLAKPLRPAPSLPVRTHSSPPASPPLVPSAQRLLLT